MYTFNTVVIESTHSMKKLLLKVYFQWFIYLMLDSTGSLIECSLKYYKQNLILGYELLRV